MTITRVIKDIKELTSIIEDELDASRICAFVGRDERGRLMIVFSEFFERWECGEGVGDVLLAEDEG